LLYIALGKTLLILQREYNVRNLDLLLIIVPLIFNPEEFHLDPCGMRGKDPRESP